MKPLALFILAVASACISPAEHGPDEIHAVSLAFLNLPVKFDEVLARDLPPDATKALLKSLIGDTCTDPLLTRLQSWVSSLPIGGHQYPDVIQSLRTMQPAERAAAVSIIDSTASSEYRIVTQETFSLANNLERAEDLFESFNITNTTLTAITTALQSQHVPELVEFRLHVNKRILLTLRSSTRGMGA